MPIKLSCLVRLTRSSSWPLIFEDKHGTGSNHIFRNIIRNSQINSQLSHKTSSLATPDSGSTLNKLSGISMLKQQLRED
jgi:hypothetical protein